MKPVRLRGGYVTFGQEDEEEAEKYRKLFEKGNLFEITEGVNFTAAPDADGMDLRVFIRTSKEDGLEGYQLTGEEELLFLYLNSSEKTVTASLNIDGQVSGTAVVKAYQEAFSNDQVPERPEDTADKILEETSDQSSIEDKADEYTDASDDHTENDSSRPESPAENSDDESQGKENGESQEETAQEDQNETSGEEVKAPEDTLGEEGEAPDQNPEETSETKEEESGKEPEEIGDEGKEDPKENETEALDESETKASETDQAKEDTDQAKNEDGESVNPEGNTQDKQENKEENENKGNNEDQTSDQADLGKDESGKPDSKEEDIKAAESADRAAEGNGEGTQTDQEADSKDGTEEKDVTVKGSDGLSRSVNPVRMVEKGASKTYGLVAVDETTTAVVVSMSLLDTGFIPQSQDLSEDVPEAVLAFLNAVAKIPAEITPENAEEAEALLYGEVADALEALLGTEDFERADVQAAYGKMEAALEAVNAALGLEAEGYLAGIESGYQGIVYKTVGETGFYQRLPRLTYVCKTSYWWGYCGNVLIEYIPDGYKNLSQTLTEQSILKNRKFVLGSYKGGSGISNDYVYVGKPCFEYGYTAAKPGKTTVTLYYEYGYYVSSKGGYCNACKEYKIIPGDWNTYSETVWFDVIVTANYRVTYQPGGNNVTNMPVPNPQDWELAYWLH